MDINWYPGHMTRAKRQLEAKLKLIDLAVLVVDARAPRSTGNPDLEAMFEAKARLLVLNKSDLADDRITRRWADYYRQRGWQALDYSATSGRADKLLNAIDAAGAELREKYAARGQNKIIRAVVAGIPNVGKSAILNRLTGGSLKVGNKPGVTRGQQWVRVSPHLELMDTPGMLWPKIENERDGALIALIGSIKAEVLDEEQLCFYLIDMLRQSAPELLTSRYKLDSLGEDAGETMSNICKQRGFLLKKGEYDYERAAKTVLSEFKNGKLGRISLEVPEDHR